jgi:serine/threonine-protein kinase SRPK3
MVFEIMGVNLLEIIKRYDYKGVPIPLVRKIAKQ